jgi:hypothetical protein
MNGGCHSVSVRSPTMVDAVTTPVLSPLQ